MVFRSAYPSSLADDEIQVWSAALNYPAEQLADLSSLLSGDEKARAARFYFERDRQHYVAARGLLRVLLGRYLGLDPASIVLNYGPQGKPIVEGVHPDRRLEFNLAHSKDLALYAFRWDRPVGIDVEHVHPIADEDAFAQYFYSANECALIGALSGRERTEAFFRIWTCKEAILKAIGSGLTRPINLTEVELEDGDSARMIALDGDEAKATTWQLRTFEPARGYRASLASERPDWKLALAQIYGND